MPKGTKLTRAGKLAGRRLVYVSWLEPNATKQAWVFSFFERLRSETWPLESSFESPIKTGDAKAGEVTEHWFEALLRGPSARRAHRITDIVGVFTNSYVLENVSRSDSPARGELARVFELIKADKEDCIRVWLAPVDPPTWKNYRVCEVVLADPDGAHRSWLTRLKEAARFKWPDEDLPACTEEIADAVARIIDRPE